MSDDKTHKARQFVSEVAALAKKYELPFFIVTDGASAVNNINCDAVEHARMAHVEWEIQHGIDPEHDWGYSESHLAHLWRGVAALNSGKGVEHEIIE